MPVDVAGERHRAVAEDLGDDLERDALIERDAGRNVPEEPGVHSWARLVL